MSAQERQELVADLLAAWMDRVGVKAAPQEHVAVFADFLLERGWTRKERSEAEVKAPSYPECPAHREFQHRDGKPPWCPDCGWNRGRPAVPPRQIRTEPRR